MELKNASLVGAMQPMAKLLVSCRHGGENNALAVVYCGNCSFDPPMVMVGIVPERYSYHMIKESGCFVVNLPSKDNQELFNYLGSVSRRDEDKLSKCAWKDADKVDAPILTDCPVSIECTVVDSIRTGSHEMFIGKVEAVHAAAVTETGEIDWDKIQLL